jgi:hypothetical protein
MTGSPIASRQVATERRDANDVRSRTDRRTGATNTTTTACAITFKRWAAKTGGTSGGMCRRDRPGSTLQCRGGVPRT